ncbi:MAG: ATP-binding protein [Salinivirgaceae bacterium]|nr:ATP-binding protein [Salinivirgaceae bacterium]
MKELNIQIIVYALILFHVPLALNSQSLKFKHFSDKDGLSINTVQTIAQDNEGFIWIGTTNGLDKFDGNNFKEYIHSPHDSTSLSNNIIWDILLDSKGDIWIGTENGLNKYNEGKDNFERYVFDPNDSTSIPNSLVKDILETKSGDIWIATYCGILSLYDKENNYFKNFEVTKVDDIFTNERINCIAEDQYKNIWIGTEGRGVFIYNPRLDEVQSFTNQENNKNSIGHNIVHKILVDSKNNIWIGTASGLNRFIGYNKGFQRYLPDPKQPNSIKPGIVDDIFEDRQGRIWIGIDGGGLNLFESENTFIHYGYNSQDINSISSNIVRSIFEDRSGNLWVGTFNAGLNLHNRLTNPFKSFFHNDLDSNSLSHSSVMSFLEDKNDNLWIGTDGGGLNMYNEKEGAFINFQNKPDDFNSLSSNAILCMYQDKLENLWIGTFNGGLNKFDIESKKFTRYLVDYENSGTLSNPHVWCIFEDSRDNLWLGTMGGGLNLMNRDDETFEQYLYDEKDTTTISSFLIWSIFEDSKGRLWIGTHNGLNLFNYETKTFKSYQFNEADSNSISNNWVLDIFEDSRNNLWVSTYSGGLNHFNPDKGIFKSITIDDGMPNNIVLGVLEDKSGFLWIGTKGGIVKMNPQNFELTTFDESYGIRSNDLNIGAFFKNKKGELFFGSNNGLERFWPQKVETNNEKARIVLTDLYVLNKRVNVSENEKRLTKQITKADEIYLTRKDYSFSIAYSALNYFATSKYKFAYMLEGFDKTWIDVGSIRLATYTNLDPGEYTFKVKAANDVGLWNEDGASIKIIILPAWWQTWWFRFVILFLMVLVLYISYLFKVRNIQQHRILLKDEVKERTNELFESNTQLEEMNQEINQQKEELITQAEILAKTNKKLEKSTTELEDHKNNLEQIVQVRTAELKKSKERAEESDRLKTAFLANMSHEIRTPMNAIVGFSNLLKQANLSKGLKDNYVAQITSNTNSLLLLIDDILDLSMMESNLLSIQKKNFELNILLDEIYLDASIRNSNLDLRLFNSVEDSKYILNSDRFRVKQILVNLFSNACKFTEKGYVELRCELIENQLVFSVKDNGIGISKENLEIIFNRFSKITDDKTKLFRGAGLGLAISKKIATLLGGELTVESVLGIGSKFSLSIPADVIVKSDIQNGDNVEAEIYDWSTKKILIVEDEDTNYSYLESALTITKVEVEWAKDGKVAVDLIKSGVRFDAILMDIKMPIMNGYDATLAIREMLPNQIIIAQTAYARSEDYVEIKKAGFNEYLIKPIIHEELYAILAKYLKP